MNKKNGIWNSWQLIAFSLLTCSIAHANPSDPIVLSGTAAFENLNASTLSITTSDKAVINWNEFSIDAGELTQFSQPSSQSVVVNRVTSDLSSVLLGSLKANGKIFLLNPNGILIGENASIDTSSFIASTLSANLQDLLSDTQDVLFQGSSTATITNLGSITAWDGDVYLISYQLDNRGSIDAPNGTAAIGAGQEVLLQPTAVEKIVIRPSLAKYEISSSIGNSGSIAACRAELKADGNAYAMAINHTGSIDAIGIDELNGEVYLTAGNGNNGVYGTITASNADGTGGSVQILGDHIALLNNALVDASGDMGGGTVLIGGDKSGSNPAIWNAQTTYVDQNVSILANALVDGNGGKVITWADETTCFYGKISARGGENSGDGGFVEISGKQSLQHYGMADRMAPHGRAGTLLLDPLDITISLAADSNVNASTPFAPTGAGSNLSWGTLLGGGGLGGGNTIVKTASGGGGTGTITVSDGNSYTSSNSLTLDNTANSTTGNIVINGAIYNSGTGDIDINSYNDIDLNYSIGTTGGNLNLTTTAGNGGKLNVSGAAGANFSQCNNLNATIDGDINITGGATSGYQCNINALLNATITSTTGNITITGGSATITFSGVTTQNAGAVLTVNAPNGDLTVQSGTVSPGGVSSTQGTLVVNVKNNILLDTTAVTVATGQQPSLNGGTGVTITSGTLTMTTGEDGTTIESVNGIGSPVMITLTGDLTMSALGTVTGVNSIQGNGVTITTAGNLVMNGATSGNGTSYITAYNNATINAKNVIMTGNANDTYIQTRDGFINITASQAVTLNNPSSIQILNVPSDTPQPLLVIAGTDITISPLSAIYNQTPGTVTLVCDNDFPTSPFFGPGKFTNLGSVTTTGGAPLWVFTSQRPLNTTGTVNVAFIPGPLYVNSTSEQWLTWYNNTSNGTPYKIFYKNGPYVPPPPVPPVVVQTAVVNFNAAAFEFLQSLNNCDVFWYWTTKFSSQYDSLEYNKFHHHEGLTSSDVFGKKIFHLLRKSYKEQNGKVIDLIR